MGALDGIRVIDFGHYIAGPLAAVMLADQGADVIHVDAPGVQSFKHYADAFYNRGKRRITLDLKSEADRDIAIKLIERADILIENFRPGVMERMGLGAEAMTKRNPALVYTSMPGFAPDDPRADMQAWEGILDAATENCIPRTGEEPEGWDWSRPFYSALPLASNFGAFFGAIASVMALIARERMGRGQVIEAPLFDAVFTLIGHSGAYVDEQGWHPPRPIHGRGAGAFRCADGKYVQFDTSSARHLVWFAHEAGITNWGPDFVDPVRASEPANNKLLHARLRELFLTKTAEEWERIGNKAGAAIGWCRSVQEWIDTEHARAIKAVVQLDDPELGPTWMAGVPCELMGSPGAVKGPRHRPDADRADILAELDRVAPREARAGAEPNLQHPLEGFKAVDACVALAGPTCGRLLSEFGADVVKINAPKGGVGGYLNRGKRSLLLDLESFEAQQVFWKLIEESDVLVENLSPGTADRLGIGYTEVSSRKPDIVYTSGSAYGYGGPMTSGRGWERQGQAVAGIMERLGTPAVLGPYNLIDIGTGSLATFATSLALFHRMRTGQGQHASASLCQTATYQQTPYMFSFKGYQATEPRGYEALGTGPFDRFYQAADRWLFLSVPKEDRQSLARVEGLEGLDPAAADVEAELEARFRKEDAAKWAARIQAHGLSAHAVVTVAELMTDDYVRRRGLSVSQHVEGVGNTTAPGVPVKLSATPMRVGEPRQPGSDAEAILAGLGMAEALPKLERAWVLQVNDLPKTW